MSDDVFDYEGVIYVRPVGRGVVLEDLPDRPYFDAYGVLRGGYYRACIHVEWMYRDKPVDRGPSAPARSKLRDRSGGDVSEMSSDDWFRRAFVRAFEKIPVVDRAWNELVADHLVADEGFCTDLELWLANRQAVEAQ